MMDNLKNPLVSVYIPTHNRADLVCQAVASVLDQTYANIEVVVCIDGGSDDTPSRLAQLAESDPRLKYVQNERPMGANVSRNAAIAASSGEFVTGLDDDDHFKPLRVESFVIAWQLLVRAGESPSFLYAQDIYNDGASHIRTRKPSRLSVDDLCYRNLLGNQIFTEKTRLLSVGGYDSLMPAWQDLDLWIRMTHQFGPGHLVDLASLVFNDDDRPDRITKGSRAKIRSAYERIIVEKPYLTSSQRQNLFLQYMGGYYGFPVTFRDLKTAYALNPGARSLIKLARLLKWRIQAMRNKGTTR